MPPAHRRQAEDPIERDFQRALALQKLGRSDAAAQLYRGVLKRRPRHVDALQLLGALQGQRGQIDEALALLNQALALQPDHIHALNNLGRALAQQGQDTQALDAFEKSLALHPEQATALIGRGRVLRKLKRHDEALACFDDLLQRDPTSVEGLTQRAHMLSVMARNDPSRRDAAVQAIRAALPYSHSEEEAHYALASLGAEPVPAAPPRDFVARLFDDYAEKFDSHLTQVLKYQAPHLIAQAVQDAGAPPPALALDLGCGTGLCGHWLRPLATRLVGVDLSAKMLDKARERGLYDELACAELVEFVAGVQETASLIVAADVFIYIGDLQAVFSSCARVLQPGGLFAFSVERLDEGDYTLRATRRYAHGRAYVAGLAAAQGFVTVSAQDSALRQESGQDVMGTLFVLRREG